MEIKSVGSWPEGFVDDVHLARCSIEAEGFITGECGIAIPRKMLSTLKKSTINDESLYEDFMKKYFNVIAEDRGGILGNGEVVVYALFGGLPILQREGETIVVAPRSYCVITEVRGLSGGE